MSAISLTSERDGASAITETLLQFDSVGFAFPTSSTYVLRDIDYAVRRGNIVSLLGPSGCGKTTMMRLSAGLLRPTEGRVIFDGIELGDVNTSVGYMTQNDTLIPWRTLEDNLRLPLEIRRVAKELADDLVAQQLDTMDLTSAVHLFPSQLSGGMKRRALLARSLIYQPAMLLMDEPFAALDAQLRARLHVELNRVIRLTQQTVLFITHDIREAALISDRVVVLGGTPTRVIEERILPFGKERDLTSVEFSAPYAEECRQLTRLLKADEGSF